MTLEQEKRRRGLSLKAYLDPEGLWKIGYGSPAQEGETCTAAEAEARLIEELRGEQ
jgi:GH24 family phage-related lysozyme (muramidase)